MVFGGKFFIVQEQTICSSIFLLTKLSIQKTKLWFILGKHSFDIVSNQYLAKKYFSARHGPFYAWNVSRIMSLSLSATWQ